MVTLDLLAIPEGADSVRDWIVWGAAIVGGLVAIGVGIYKIGTWARAAAAAGVFDLMEPKFDEINQKMDTLAERNDMQHAQVAGQIAELSHELAAHNKVLTDHLDESASAADKLAAIVQTVETHLGQLRDEITSPGLPVTPSAGPPPGTKHLY